MNNTINAMNNISFNARYLRLTSKTAEFPQKISDAIYKNDAIDEFLKAGRPKTFWGKIKDFFSKEECLDITYEVEKTSKTDPFARNESILFSFPKKKGGERYLFFETSQKGIKREFGTIPKEGENPFYKEPYKTATDVLAANIEGIENLDKLLK